MSYSRLNAAMRSFQLHREGVSTWMGLLGTLTFLSSHVLAAENISDTDVQFSLNQHAYGAHLLKDPDAKLIADFIVEVTRRCGMVTDVIRDVVPFSAADSLHFIKTLSAGKNQITLWRENVTDIHLEDESCLATCAQIRLYVRAINDGTEAAEAVLSFVLVIFLVLGLMAAASYAVRMFCLGAPANREAEPDIGLQSKPPVRSCARRLEEIGVRDSDIPEEYLCPITRAVMTDPVLTHDCHTYEREEIVEWFKRSSTSPLTNLPLESKELLPNRALKKCITKYVEAQERHVQRGSLTATCNLSKTM